MEKLFSLALSVFISKEAQLEQVTHASQTRREEVWVKQLPSRQHAADLEEPLGGGYEVGLRC